MIALRPEQMNAFDSYMRESFIQRMAGHLRRSFPRQCEGLSEESLRARIERGMERAKSYGILKERDVARYLDVGMVFGENFDTQCDWAAAYLKGSGNPSVRMKLLFEQARQKANERGIR